MTYRQNSHVVALIAWAVLCSSAAAVLFVTGHRSAAMIGGAALLVFGPAALVVYVLRANLVWVKVDPEKGIVVGGSRVIPWSEIERIERRRPRLRRTTGSAEAGSLGTDRSCLGGCDGCIVVDGEAALLGLGAVLLAGAVIFLFWLVFLVVVPLIIVPVLEVFAPLGDRIRIVTAKRVLVLRDLRDADAFLAEVRPRVPISES